MRRHTTLMAATIAGGVVLALTVGGCTAENKGSASNAPLNYLHPHRATAAVQHERAVADAEERRVVGRELTRRAVRPQNT
jgi:hypothetical protein